MTTPTDRAVRSTLLHYAQISAQLSREAARQAGNDLFVDAQCPNCGLHHASDPCHPYMKRLAKGETQR